MSLATYRGPSVPDDPTPPVQPREISLAGLWSLIARRRGVIFLVFLAVFAATSGSLLLQPKTYTAMALVMIEPNQPATPGAPAPTNIKPDSAAIDSEVELLNSREMARMLASSMRLDRDPRWSNTPATKPTAGAPSAELVDKTQDAIDAHRRGLTYVVEVAVKAHDPQTAAAMANNLVALYRQSKLTLSEKTAGDASAWLDQRLEQLRLEVQTKERAIEEYRAQMGLATADGSSLTEQQVTEAQTAMLAARADLAASQARSAQVQMMIAQGGSPEAVAGAINSDTIRDLRAKEAEIARRQADMENRYGEKHPSLTTIRQERGDVQGQISAEIARITANLKSETEVNRQRLGTLQSYLGQARGNLNANNTALIQLRELERDAAAARAVFEGLLQRSQEISTQGAVSSTTARLVSSATPPTAPSSPGLALICTVAAALGALIGLFAGLLVQHFDHAVDSADDLTAKTGLSTIVSIPMIRRHQLAKLPAAHRHPPGFLVKNPLSAFAESFRVLRGSIVYGAKRREQNIVTITSALPGEGKTTTALCLARMAAISGERVIILDCDLRRRALNEVLDIAPKVGLVEVLDGTVRWRDAIGVDDYSRAHVLPLASSQIPLQDYFGSQEMRQLVKELSLEYDLVILDSAPILAVADTRALISMSDHVFIVSRWRKTTDRALLSAVAQIKSIGATPRVALNCVDPRQPGAKSYSDSLYYAEAAKAYYHA